jgi:FAD/FMN-containing dehydrogenase
MKRYESWGRYCKAKHLKIIPISWKSELPSPDKLTAPLLPFGQGRSYGDSCLNDGGSLLDTGLLNRFIAFDRKLGLLRCEAGITIGEIMKIIVPCGWFVPVTPGTKYVSLGGAIANDIHGKNHHRAGSFGCHVTQFELMRSTGERILCSPDHNTELFRATIGGLGLTGLVLWAELRLKPICSTLIAAERICMRSLEEFFEVSALSDRDHEYTVAWVDCIATGDKLGRGIFMRGNHAEHDPQVIKAVKKSRTVQMPFEGPSFLLNRFTMRGFNAAYYYSQSRRKVQEDVNYETFFYPLDAVNDWNRLYGKRGFLQYQCVVPHDDSAQSIKDILSRVTRSGVASFLAILKVFGPIRSPGMLSFPRPGVTLALDLPYRGVTTLQILEELDRIVRASRGAVYPAKDARMSPTSFQTYFPQWREFSQFIDPKFSSSFWRRVAVELDEDKDEKNTDHWGDLKNCARDGKTVCIRGSQPISSSS